MKTKKKQLQIDVPADVGKNDFGEAQRALVRAGFSYRVHNPGDGRTWTLVIQDEMAVRRILKKHGVGFRSVN